MRKNIIQSKTEPNKNDIWLSEEGLKKYSKNGWEPLGGGSNNSGGESGPVIIEYPFYGNEAVTLTDEQINAVKDGNIKIKLTVPDNNACVIVLPEFYEISDDEAYISVYQPSLEGGRSNVVYLVNNANKTITKE